MVSLQTLQQLDLNVILGKTEGYVAQDLENLVSRAIHSHTIQQGKELNFFIVPSYQCKSIRQQLHVAVLMKFKMLSLLFHVGMNVGSTAEKITSQDICDHNLPLSTVYMFNRWSLYHPSSRYLYLFGGNTWSLKTFYSKHCLLPWIFVLTFSSLDLEFIYPAVSSCSSHLQRCFWCYEERHTCIR